MPDIYYFKPNSYKIGLDHEVEIDGRVTIVKDGTDVFYELFKCEYKTVRAASWETACETNRFVFLSMMSYFIDEGTTGYVDTELITCIRNHQLANKYRSNVASLVKVPWSKLKDINIPKGKNIIDKDAIAQYIIVPLCRSRISITHLRDVWKEKVNKGLWVDKDNLAVELKSMYAFLSEMKSAYCTFSNPTTFSKLYNRYFEEPEILISIAELMRAYSRMGSRQSSVSGFPTIDSLVKNILECQDVNVCIKLISNYTNACRTQNIMLLGIDTDSSLPAAWQVAIKTKNSILDELSWENLYLVLEYLYPNQHYMNEKAIRVYEKDVVGITFRRLIKNKSTEEMIDILYDRFLEITGTELTLDTLRQRYIYLSNIASINNSMYSHLRPRQIEKCRELLKLDK